ncbi:hypothetical protein DSM3645_08787 [Blastopirellula marina DSM 3645]|uniref:Uncharacterized protein n=1 Tax=Blastopirellula marina DSM 3645 TaxID=314230 RepID=A3ZL48_9BACT|nr:hypothetical protein DSM3645_08787 [Blastopirellula marina DSM 3645]
MRLRQPDSRTIDFNCLQILTGSLPTLATSVSLKISPSRDTSKF